MRRSLVRLVPLLALAGVLACAGLAGAEPFARVPAAADSLVPGTRDMLLPLLEQTHAFLRAHEVNGVTMDSRYAINPSEAIRMGVVCQLLGYTELAKLRPREMFQPEILAHARFLDSRLDSVRSGTPFDGMLGYALVEAWLQTRDSVTFAAASIMMDELLALPTDQCVLNGGLMVAMATADWANATGSAEAAQKTSTIVGFLPAFQNDDGSFPHWCGGSEDIHYTGWMAEELVLIQRLTGDSRIEPILARMRDFIEARLAGGGITSYVGPCPGDSTCQQAYDSQHSGCWYDYDTRDWTVEPAYNAQLLDHFESPTYAPVMKFLDSLATGGTWSDKYGYIPPPDDPEYPWSIADTSVANTSINFWVLATIVTGRARRGGADLGWLLDGDLTGAPRSTGNPGLPAHPDRAPDGPLVQLAPPAPNPARGACTLRFALGAAGEGELAIHDAAGRRVRTLAAGALEPGPHAVAWDGRDAQGRACAPGVYFARLRAGGVVRESRLVFVR